ncbi:hypothetical protein HYZ97_00190 [Candidatus Pacearchaeota archaeon]|nr:hypothetical protein [Candidatus Pacearchaeota archaeon]
MNCNCQVTEVILAIVIIVFALWSSLAWGKWVVVIAAALLLIHALKCNNCRLPEAGMASSRKKRR